jgi:hypothetical protein
MEEQLRPTSYVGASQGGVIFQLFTAACRNRLLTLKDDSYDERASHHFLSAA